MIKDLIPGEMVPEPICPINMYFEGDENKCDTSKCDFDLEFRNCTRACEIEQKNATDIISLEKLIILTKAACELLQDWTLCPDCSEAFGYWYRTKGKEDSILIIEYLLRKGMSPKEAATLIYQQHKAF